MRRFVLKLMLAIALLSGLPVVGTEMSGKSPVVAVKEAGASVHVKTSSWPVITPHPQVASGHTGINKTEI